jgi:hypothetical protein
MLPVWPAELLRAYCLGSLQVVAREGPRSVHQQGLHTPPPRIIVKQAVTYQLLADVEHSAKAIVANMRSSTVLNCASLRKETKVRVVPQASQLYVLFARQTWAVEYSVAVVPATACDQSKHSQKRVHSSCNLQCENDVGNALQHLHIPTSPTSLPLRKLGEQTPESVAHELSISENFDLDGLVIPQGSSTTSSPHWLVL